MPRGQGPRARLYRRAGSGFLQSDGVLGGLRLHQERGALAMGLQYDLKQAVRSVWRLLREPSDTPACWDIHVALLNLDNAGDDAKQRGLTGPITADQTDARAGRNAR